MVLLEILFPRSRTARALNHITQELIVYWAIKRLLEAYSVMNPTPFAKLNFFNVGFFCLLSRHLAFGLNEDFQITKRVRATAANIQSFEKNVGIRWAISAVTDVAMQRSFDALSAGAVKTRGLFGTIGNAVTQLTAGAVNQVIRRVC